MVLKITLDLAEAVPADQPLVQKRFQQWRTEFSLEEVVDRRLSRPVKGRHKKLCISVMFGKGDIITAIHSLHERLYDSGVQIFINFVYENEIERGQT